MKNFSRKRSKLCLKIEKKTTHQSVMSKLANIVKKYRLLFTAKSRFQSIPFVSKTTYFQLYKKPQIIVFCASIRQDTSSSYCTGNTKNLIQKNS